MIIGIGTDVVHIPRIQALLDKFGQRFEDKIFTEGERTLARTRTDVAATYAKRWAAKEALFKALGTGFRDGIVWHDVATELDRLGKPHLRVTGEASKKLWQRMPAPEYQPDIQVSLSDDPPVAQAFVIIQAVPRDMRG